jgi:hypothetical protein
VILVLEGQPVDLLDDKALLAAIEQRTTKIVARLNQAEAYVREEQLLNVVTFIALKAGALVAYHAANPDLPVDLAHVREVAAQLNQIVGINMVTDAEQPTDQSPQIILPPGAAANEGDDSGSEEG